jgi:hypothetical protein
MKSIYTLIPDIYRLVGKKDGWFTTEIAYDLGKEIALKMQATFGERKDTPTLRLSKMGDVCPKALWYSIHHPELAEPFTGPNIIKFSYGNTIEAMAIALAKAAGHEVTGEQDELVVDGIRGHRDCVIDGFVVDVKSVSSLQFPKYSKGTVASEGDSFGYLAQLDGYMVGSADDDLVRHKDRAFIWAIDKTLGSMALYEHNLREDFIRGRIQSHKQIVSLDVPPRCECKIVKDGEGGNLRLGYPSNYNSFKWACFPHLRCFIYSDGPHYLTTMVRRPQPHIKEVDRLGNTVYNNGQ